MKKVVIYTTPVCAYCKMAEKFFKENNIPYEERDISSDPVALQEILAKSKQLIPPVFDIEGVVVTGFDKKKLKEVLGII